MDGIIGTVLLYHFLVTMDYPRGELVLRRNTKDSRERFLAGAKTDSSIEVPFWMAGDHFMVAWGRVEKNQPVLLFVDTGLAGGGVTLAQSVLDEAGIQLSQDKVGEGIGGGGKVKVTPFIVKELSLGDAKEQDVRGLFTGPFPLENSMGFRIGGIISHGFFRSYALTFDFTDMRLYLSKGMVKGPAGSGQGSSGSVGSERQAAARSAESRPGVGDGKYRANRRSPPGKPPACGSVE